MLAEAADFPNAQDEFAGGKSAVPPINQNIVVADNIFTTDHPQALVNVSSANNVVFYRNSFRLELRADESTPVTYNEYHLGGSLGQRQYPVTIHDASHVFFNETSTYSSWMPQVSCDDSIMLALSTPSPVVSPFAPIACRVAATSSGLDYAGP
jgi:hypothetical protein